MLKNLLPLSTATLLALGGVALAQDAQPVQDAVENAANDAVTAVTEAANDAVDAVKDAANDAVAEVGTAAAEATGSDTDAAPAEAAPAATEAAPAAASTETEAAAPEAPQAGQPYVRAEYTDWALRCIKAEEGPDPCQLYQLLTDSDGNAVAEVSMFPLPEGQRAAAGATIVVPLETLLTEQLLLSVDGGKPRVYPYSFCNRAGCVARIGFTKEDIAAFKAGNAAELVMVPAAAPDEKVKLNMSLSGFTAGFDASAIPAQ